MLGGAGPEFSYQALNRVFGYLRDGAALVAMHRNMFWRTDEGLHLDSGAFLAGLEQAAGVQAEVTGKPAGGVLRHRPRCRRRQPGRRCHGGRRHP